MLHALFAAGLWGSTDAFAGIAARRSTPLLAALWLHISSLAVLLPFIATGSPISSNAVLYGALAGITAAIGDVLFGRALSKSAMSVGIPLANVIAATIPVLVVVIQGEPLSPLGVLGILGAIAATSLAAAPSNGRLAAEGAGYSTAAGLCFGIMYALLAQVRADDALIVIFVMRLAGTVVLLPGLLQIEQRSGSLIRSGALAGIASGLASVGANALYIVAMTSGGSGIAASVVAVALSAPAGVLIARLFGREHLTLLQGASAGSAIAAIAVLALREAVQTSIS